MGYYAIEDETEDLQHHGIKGQRWGVRRFQNPDGTRTAAGKRREREDSSDTQNDASKKSINGKTVAKAALGALAVGGTAFLIANPTTRAALAKYGKTEVSKIKDKFSKENLKETGKKIGKKVAERASKAGDAMIDAALMSIGGIAISKLAKKLAPAEDATEGEKIRSKIAIDTASAGIRTMTGGANNSNYSSGNKNSGAKVDRGSKEYQNLFNGLENDEAARDKIRNMAKEGASMEDLQKYRDSIQHYDFGEWNESFVFSEFRW